jgi:hypothetical protein
VLRGTAGSQLRAMTHSGELQLRAMPQSRESKLWAMLHSTELLLLTMRHSMESTHIHKFLGEFTTLCKNIFTRWSVTQVGLIHENNQWFKGTVSQDFLFYLIFLLNGTPRCPDSWAKEVLNIDSNSTRNSIRFDYENWLWAMPHSAVLIFFVR